jgi:hypothetical protein
MKGFVQASGSVAYTVKRFNFIQTQFSERSSDQHQRYELNITANLQPAPCH